MRLRVGVVVAVVGLLLVQGTSVIAKTPKVGSVCAKQGLTQTVKQVRFVCVRQGKRLVWKRAQTQRPPTTQTSTQPTPTPSPSRQFVPPTEKPRRAAALDPATSWYFAWSSMNDVRIGNSSVTGAYQIESSPNVRSDVQAGIVESLNAAASFWSDYWMPSEPLLVIIGTEKDEEFWKKAFAPLYDARWHRSPDELFDNVMESFAQFGSRNNSAGANWFTNRPNMNFPFGSAISADEFRKSLWQTPAHEYTHLVQGTLGYAFNLGGMGTVWMMEGQAEITGIFLSAPTPESYLEYRNQRLVNQWRSPEQASLVTAEQIVEAMDGDGVGDVFSTVYSFGAVAWEALVALHGQDSVLNYFRSIRAGDDWGKAFQQHFGVGHHEFLVEIAPYLARQKAELVR